MNTRKTQVVVLNDAGGALTSKVYASAPGLVASSKLDDCYPMVASKLSFDELTEGWIVRSVLAGSRRKIEVISGGAAAIDAIIQLTRGEKKLFIGRSSVEFASGDTLIELDATLVASHK